MQIQSPVKQSDKSVSSDFMLEEYKMLRERFHSLRSEGVNRLNFFITLTSVVVGGVLVWGSSNNVSPVLFKSVLLVALLLLASVGLDVFWFMVTRHRATDKVQRGMNRVRRYFVECDPSLTPYFCAKIRGYQIHPCTLTTET